MSRNRRLGALLTSVLLANVLAPLAADPAVAAETQQLAVVGDVDGDGNSDLTIRNIGDATVVKVVEPGSAFVRLGDITTSPDGSRFAYVRTLVSAVRQQLVVADAGGRQVRVVTDVDYHTSYIGRPTVSPDSQSIAYPKSVEGATSSSQTVYKAPVGAGLPTRISNSQGVFAAAWTSASEMVGLSLAFGPVRLPVAGSTGELIKITGLSDNVSEIVASPGTGKVVLTRYSGPSFDRSLLSASYSAGAFSAVTAITDGTGDAAASFSPDGGTVYFTRATSGAPDLWRTPTAGPPSAATAVTTTADRTETGVGVLVVDDVAPTTAPTLGVATLSGTSARIAVTGLESDVSGVLLTRRLNGTAQKTDVYAPVSAGSFIDTGLAVGQTYDYTVKQVDRSGNAPSPASVEKSLTAIAPPTFAVADPTSRAHLRTPFLVTFSTTNKAGTIYDVFYRNVATSATSTKWVTTTATTRTFGLNGLPVTVTPGAVYAFSGVARDAFGNSTALAIGATRAVVPFDQTKAAFTSTAVTTLGSDRWLGSFRTLSRVGQKATLTVTGNRLQVIGEKGSTGGKFDVYLKNSSGTFSRIAIGVSAYATVRSARQVLYTHTASTVATRVYEIRWVVGATSTRKNVALDGFAVRR